MSAVPKICSGSIVVEEKLSNVEKLEKEMALEDNSRLSKTLPLCNLKSPKVNTESAFVIGKRFCSPGLLNGERVFPVFKGKMSAT